MSNSILLAPGPVQLHPEVQKILSLPMIHHRTPEFDLIFKSALQNLKLLFRTTQPAFMLSSTGSGGMECLLVNVLNEKEKVLAVINGKFGERWADMAQAYGAEILRYETPWGLPASVDEIKKILNQHPDIKIVLIQACETSTATKNPLQEIAAAVASTEALLLVDGITALGAYDIPMEQWKIDGLVGGSQKAFMLPTGMSFVAFSEKAWKKIKTSTSKKFYFDIQKELAANLKGETLFSSNVPLIRALDFVLKRILHYGLSEHYKHIARRALYTRTIIEKMGLEVFSSSPSESVTAVRLPSTIDGIKFRNDLEKHYHLTVMGGQDQLKGRIIRLGHMGYITDRDLHETTLRLTRAFNENNYQINLNEIESYSKKLLEGQV